MCILMQTVFHHGKIYRRSSLACPQFSHVMVHSIDVLLTDIEATISTLIMTAPQNILIFRNKTTIGHACHFCSNYCLFCIKTTLFQTVI